MESVAVPTFPTTIPAALLAAIALCLKVAPEAIDRPRIEITVSPAPETSKEDW